MRCWTLKRARITNGIEGVNYKLKQITWRMRRWVTETCGDLHMIKHAGLAHCIAVGGPHWV